MKSALKGMQVFKGGGPWNSGEKKAKVEVLSRSRVGMIHSANSKTVLVLRQQQALADSGLDEGLCEGLHLSRSFWLVLEHC
jgi:hypothetical protein